MKESLDLGLTPVRSRTMGSHQLAVGGATNDWITPPDILAALGPFDLDPCASSRQPWPTATRMIAPPEDGLRAEWKGRVWLNPPYGPNAGSFLRRIADHGNGIALIFARTETEWFRRYAWERADGILFLARRITFFRPDGRPGRGNSGAPSALIAYGGTNVERLAASGLTGFLVEGWRRVA